MIKKHITIDDFYDEIRNASEKFYVCYKALGWEVTHGWVDKPTDIERTLTELVEHAVKELNRGKKGYIATGGFKVNYDFDGDYAATLDIDIELESKWIFDKDE